MATAVIAGLAGAIGTAAAGISIFGLAVGLPSIAAAFAIGAGLSLVSQALMPSIDLGAAMEGRSITTREAAQSRKIVYGRARVGGNIVYLESTGTDNKYLWLVIAVAGHEIDAFEEVWFNDVKIWDGSFVGTWGNYVSIGFHKGDQTTADAGLNAASTKWTSDHKLLDTAYMVVRLTYDVDQFANGLPNISTVVRGKKVLNPATSVTEWSQNPALCVYDYLRDTKYGLGETVGNILTSSITAAATVCEETVTLAAGGTQKRYQLDGVVDTAGSIKGNLDSMLGSMIGRLVFSAGKFEIYAGEYVAPTYSVDESVAVGDISIQTKQSRRNAYNGVKGVFLSEEDNYILADYPAQLSSTFATEDGDPIYLDMPLPFTVNNIRAQRIAKLALFRSRQQEAITIPCNLSALRFKIGDNINVTNARLGYSNKVFEVVGYNLDFADGQIVVNVDAVETAASIWDWTTSDEEVYLGAGEVALYDGLTAAAPTSLNITGDSFLNSDGTFNTAFNVAWTDADDAFTDHYVVEWKKASDSNYFTMDAKASPAVITGLQNSQQYNVRVKAVNEIGVSSTYISSAPTAAVDTTAPDAPSPVSASGQYQHISISWTNPSQKDLSHIDVYRSTSSGGTYSLIGNTDGTVFIDDDLANAATFYYKVKAIDFTGNASAFSSVVNATTTTIAAGDLGNDAVGTSNIQDDAVTNALIATDAVNQDSIAANAVTATEILAGTITATEIASNTITASQIAANTLTAAEIQASSITVDRLLGDVSETYPINYISAIQQCTGNGTTDNDARLTIPAPTGGVEKNAAVSLTLKLSATCGFTTGTGTTVASADIKLQRLSTGITTGTQIGTSVTQVTSLPNNVKRLKLVGNHINSLGTVGSISRSSTGATGFTITPVLGYYYENTVTGYSGNFTYVFTDSSTDITVGSSFYFNKDAWVSQGTYISSETFETVYFQVQPQDTVSKEYTIHETFGQTLVGENFRLTVTQNENTSFSNTPIIVHSVSGTMQLIT